MLLFLTYVINVIMVILKLSRIYLKLLCPTGTIINLKKLNRKIEWFGIGGGKVISRIALQETKILISMCRELHHGALKPKASPHHQVCYAGPYDSVKL
jgi:hypothetical protein